MRVASVGFALAALAAGTTRGGAQGLVPAAGLSIVSTRVRGVDQLTGTVVGGQGDVALGRLELALGYVQGKIGPEGASAPGQDLVEGVALLGVRPAPWLRLAVGPHARSYTLTGGTELRWVFWELRARVSGAFVGSAGRGYVELWRAVSASVNAPEPFDHAQGGEAGMVVHLARAPLELRLGYRIDHAVLGGGTRLETVDGVVIGVGLSRR
ncbi:MAG: hypothetical protein DMD73_04055 [Gemmatimonadetes bacterium]|nr:MAG: hypothetical protein DMD73_04055 [Gemmatimonadota bacterium]